MDYLCELPNDAARRNALGSLPPDLKSTYERILGRVNQSNAETQKLVRRALRWIANVGHPDFTIKALCEAVSIDFGNTKRDPEAVPDEFEILHWCSSLVRKSAGGERLELAHFTVKEFLQQVDSQRDVSIGAYRADPKNDELILAKVCLTYLSFEDFDQSVSLNQLTVQRRLSEYHFRSYAVNGWRDVACDDLGDTEFFFLMQKLLNPSKPNTFVSWMHDMTIIYRDDGGDELFKDEQKLSTLNSGFAEATALHYAAMDGLVKLCSWLIQCGCNVNRNTNIGTPLHCAIMRWRAFEWSYNDDSIEMNRENDQSSDPIIDVLLEAGADPNCYYHGCTGKLSPLYIALSDGRWGVAVRLLDSGGILDSDCLDVLTNRLEDGSEIEFFLEYATNHEVRQDIHSRLLQLALKAQTSNATRLTQKDKDRPLPIAHYEQVLRNAAKYGQTEIVKHLLEDQKLNIDAADGSTGSTALQFAARTDQLEVAQILMDCGADSNKSDRLGRTALHHAVQGREAHCLQLFLQHDGDTSLRDLEGRTVWHLAAQKGNIQALSILLNEPVDLASAIGLKTNDGRTPFLCASATGSKEAMRLLLSAGSSLTETASDGSSSLHYAAASGSLEAVNFLIEQMVDPCASAHDGSSVIHSAVSGYSERLPEIVHVLLEIGVDPCKDRNDGCTPLHDLVEMIKEKSDESSGSQLDHLFAASRILLKNLLEKSSATLDLDLGPEVLYLACLHSSSTARDTVVALLELGLGCNIPSANGRTPLMAAAESGNVAILSTLLLHGADPSVSILGLNAVHCACFKGHKSILVLLRETIIDWNSKAATQILAVRRTQVTALHIAAQCKDSSILEYLLNEDLISDIDARTNRGDTPLFAAVSAGAPRNVSLLLSNSADTTLIDDFGNSVIHWAAEWGHTEAVSEFIRHGSDLALPNAFGLTPELVARKHGHQSLAKTIMEYVNGISESLHSAPTTLYVLSNCIFLQAINPTLPHAVRDQEKPTMHQLRSS